jgi:phasin family protein
MFTMRDHFSNASQANVEAQLALNAAMADKLLEGAQRLAELNKSVSRASLQDAERAVKELLAVHNPQELITVSITEMQPALHQVFAYACHVAGISAGTESKVADLAGTYLAANNREVTMLVADVSENAPLGLDRVVVLLRMICDHANSGYEQILIVTRQVLDALEANLIAAANQFARAAEQSAAARPARA